MFTAPKLLTIPCIQSVNFNLNFNNRISFDGNWLTLCVRSSSIFHNSPSSHRLRTGNRFWAHSLTPKVRGETRKKTKKYLPSLTIICTFICYALHVKRYRKEGKNPVWGGWQKERFSLCRIRQEKRSKKSPVQTKTENKMRNVNEGILSITRHAVYFFNSHNLSFCYCFFGAITLSSWCCYYCCYFCCIYFMEIISIFFFSFFTVQSVVVNLVFFPYWYCV